MKKLLALLCLLFAGCELPTEPVFIANTQQAQIIVVSTEDCVWCDKQMDTLERMKKNGDLKGVTVKKTFDSITWPATSFPTLYVLTDSGEAKYVGYQTARTISKALDN